MEQNYRIQNVRAAQISKLLQYYFGSDEPSVVGSALANMKKAAMAQELYNSVSEKKKLSDMNLRVDGIERSARELAETEGANIDEMAENPQFIRYLINNGLSVKDAYYLVNKERFENDTLRRAKEELTASILAKKDRIAENAAISASAHKRDTRKAKHLTEDEIDDIVKRVRKGEKIVF